MSNRIEELLKFYELQGLKEELMLDFSTSEWNELTDSENKPLKGYEILGLKKLIEYRSKTRSYSDSLSGSFLNEIEGIKELRKVSNDLVESIENLPLTIVENRLVKAKKNLLEIKVQNKKNLSYFLPKVMRIASISIKRSSEIVSSIKSIGSNLDICFCLDGTGSMQYIISSVKAFINNISKAVQNSTGMKCRFGLVVYRDYCDDLRHQVFDFNNSESIASFLENIIASGGGDEAEDCFGGLMASINRLNWKSSSRLILWIGDNPQHGIQYNNVVSDDYPHGDPDGITSLKIFQALSQHKISLNFFRIKSNTDKMMDKLRSEVAEIGPKILFEYKLEGDIEKVLAESIAETSSYTGINKPSYLYGKIKEYAIEAADWNSHESLWRAEEKCILYTFSAYEGGDTHPLVDLIFFDANVEESNKTIMMTKNPFATGEFKFAYKAKLGCKTALSNKKEFKKTIVKEYKYEGECNSINILKIQANIQAVAVYLAEQFNIKAEEYNLSVKKIAYVQVALVNFTQRTPPQFYFIEEFISGNYIKFNSNKGYVNRKIEESDPILQTFSHFTYCFSGGLLIVTDLQGVIEDNGYTLTDPVIHTLSRKHLLVDPTNLGYGGIGTFFSTHKCNIFCEQMGLQLPESIDYNYMTNFSSLFQEFNDGKIQNTEVCIKSSSNCTTRGY